MYEIFERLLQERGVTAYRVSRETGSATATLTDWKMGRSTPKADKLQRIAEYFGVSLTFLLGQEEQPVAVPSSLTLDDFSYALYREAQELTEENKQKLLEMARIFKKAQKADR